MQNKIETNASDLTHLSNRVTKSEENRELNKIENQNIQSVCVLGAELAHQVRYALVRISLTTKTQFFDDKKKTNSHWVNILNVYAWSRLQWPKLKSSQKNLTKILPAIIHKLQAWAHMFL